VKVRMPIHKYIIINHTKQLMERVLLVGFLLLEI